jgi:hypothetical protein
MSRVGRHHKYCHPEQSEGPAFSAPITRCPASSNVSADITKYCHPEQSEGPAFPHPSHAALLPLMSRLTSQSIVILSKAKDLLFRTDHTLPCFQTATLPAFTKLPTALPSLITKRSAIQDTQTLHAPTCGPVSQPSHIAPAAGKDEISHPAFYAGTREYAGECQARPYPQVRTVP